MSTSSPTEGSGYKLTPVMRQYLDLKRSNEDALLFFRLGDFYEMFFEDAERAAGLLDLTLTSRNRHEDKPIPMCGVPYHAARPYIAKLLEAGVKVAICEQIDLAAKGIARREVTRVITPGTSLDEEALAPDRGNFLASVAKLGNSWGVAWTEFSTGEVHATELRGADAAVEELEAITPREVLLCAEAVDLEATVRGLLPRSLVVLREEQKVAAGNSRGDGIGTRAAAYLARCRAEPSAMAALFGLVSYLDVTQGGHLSHLQPARCYEVGSFLLLDAATRRNLELLESMDGARSASLLGVLDRSSTPMGKRLAREWILRPLCDADAIGRRLDAVEWLLEQLELRSALRKQLRSIGDLERLCGRIGAATATPRDLGKLADTAEAVQALRHTFDVGPVLPELIGRLVAECDGMPDLCALLRRAIVDEPPVQVGWGPLIRDGYHEEVDHLRSVRNDGKGWMMEFEAAERQRSGIANLKIGFNKVFGYYIEVSRAGLAKVPQDYVRKQTIANGERYVTDELKRRESEVLGAEDRLAQLEAHLFSILVGEAGRSLDAISRTATALAHLDTLVGWAESAHAGGYVRPEVVRDGTIEIRDGRHPVVESMIGQSFVPNDCRLGPEADTVMVITGPNMAGKSTYMRQVALITLLAHMGSFVPAAAARIPLIDRIFTRIGASDKVARGQSTFMVEMSETAHILHGMTEHSLVILDEIGRGTSTYDGMSIAWAVAEAMVRAGVKTLFATHYHELARLAEEHSTVGNYSVAVRRHRGEIVFLYRVEPGAASRSYGIEVAGLAGVPSAVIERAKELLEGFESEKRALVSGAGQRSLFDPEPGPSSAAARGEADLAAELRSVEVERLTAVEAMVELDRLVRKARNRQ